MGIFETEITETLQRTIEVEAENEGDALRKVKEMYKNEEIVLDSSVFVGVGFENKFFIQHETLKSMN